MYLLLEMNSSPALCEKYEKNGSTFCIFLLYPDLNKTQVDAMLGNFNSRLQNPDAAKP